MRRWKLEDTIEELVAEAPEAIGFLMEYNIRCLACGEPIWGTLGAAMQQRGYSAEECAALLETMNNYLDDN